MHNNGGSHHADATQGDVITTEGEGESLSMCELSDYIEWACIALKVSDREEVSRCNWILHFMN